MKKRSSNKQASDKRWPDPRHSVVRGAPRGRASDTLVFVGPTLAADEVRALLPAADVRPPAGVGDILRAGRARGVKRIAIIDGYFEGMAAVWHKEILVALERGIEVWGASSMGALRAAELGLFGMRGVGAIFDQFKRGVLESDDEVAVAHLPAEQGYRPASDALVNIRAGLALALKARLVHAKTAAALVELARARFYRERSWATVIAEARMTIGQHAAVGRELDALAVWPKPDQKADDARLLLRKLRSSRPVRPKRIRVPRTWALRQLESLIL